MIAVPIVDVDADANACAGAGDGEALVADMVTMPPTNLRDPKIDCLIHGEEDRLDQLKYSRENAHYNKIFMFKSETSSKNNFRKRHFPRRMRTYLCSTERETRRRTDVELALTSMHWMKRPPAVA